jgi:hypothetical protein
MSNAADDMDRQIDAWADKVRAKAQQYKALTSEMESINGQAESPSGAVRVTVNRAGVLTALEISDNVRSMRGSQLASEIMSTIRTAQSGLGDKVVALMQEKAPEDTHAINAVADNYNAQFAPPDKGDAATARAIGPDDDDDEFGHSIFQRT